MLSETYPARYRDRFGEVATTIYNDGQELRMTLRDVEFILYSMEELEPDPRTNAAQLDQFTLYPNYGCVCDYTLEFDLPIPVIFHHEPFQGVLHVHLTVEVGPLEWNFRTKLLLKLDAAGYSFSSQGEIWDLLTKNPWISNVSFQRTCTSKSAFAVLIRIIHRMAKFHLEG
jgi:hypothetical protein